MGEIRDKSPVGNPPGLWLATLLCRGAIGKSARRFLSFAFLTPFTREPHAFATASVYERRNNPRPWLSLHSDISDFSIHLIPFAYPLLWRARQAALIAIVAQ